MEPVFVLLLTIWPTGTPRPEVYALGTGLTGEQCIAQLIDSYSPTSVGILSCEVDHGEGQ